MMTQQEVAGGPKQRGPKQLLNLGSLGSRSELTCMAVAPDSPCSFLLELFATHGEIKYCTSE